MPITSPKLPKQLIKGIDINRDFLTCLEEDESLEAIHYSNQALEYQNYRQLEIRATIFDHIYFDHFELNNGYFLDVVLDSCDLSNAHLNNSLLRRVVFKDCKLVGVDFNECSFDQVRFENCLMTMASFAQFATKGLLFESCDLGNASFLEASLKKVSFQTCKLIQAEFLHASLMNVDLSNSEIDGITLTLDDLKGAIVRPSQALSLSRLLGLQIKDE